MQKYDYAPVLIATINRYEHFKRCVESLARNTHADKTELVIGLDYPPSDKYIEGWKKICNYVDNITGFKQVTILKATKNRGVKGNFEVIKEYALSKYDTYIITEDDNEFSPCFLDYVNKALKKYWDDKKVYAISGYNFPIDMSGYDKNVYFYHDQSAWGVAKWKHKQKTITEAFAKSILHKPKALWKIYRKDSRLFFLLLSMIAKKTFWGDAMTGISNILNDQLVLYPAVSMCRNHGHDGSGLNGGISKGEDIFIKQLIDDRTIFNLDEIKVEEETIESIEQYFKMPLVRKLSCVKQYLKYLLDR